MITRAMLPILVLASSLLAEPAEFPLKGFAFTFDVSLPAPPERAYDLMTGNVSGWWDHHVSDKPARLYIEPEPGGGFYEIFDDAGNGVRHAEVTSANRGKILRMEGPLGLAGRALTMVTTWTFAASDSGTVVTCAVNLSGQIDAELASVVENVWRHFLLEQLPPWVESNK